MTDEACARCQHPIEVHFRSVNGGQFAGGCCRCDCEWVVYPGTVHAALLEFGIGLAEALTNVADGWRAIWRKR